MADTFIGVMLPARIETRFVPPQEAGAPWKMKIAVIPDEPWMNRHTDVVSEHEAECLSRLWESVGNNAAVLIDSKNGLPAFREFAQQVGPARAWWLTRKHPPGEEIPTGKKPASRMDGLPDQIEIYLGIRQNGQVVLQRLVVNLLWPALWGHTLKDVWCVDRAGRAQLLIRSRHLGQ
jgi:hypothetical protein